MDRLTNKQKHILQQKLCDMKSRCYNPKNKFYKDYGARGIIVCDEWKDKKNGHTNFQKWALESGWKEFLSIDRINVDGNYEPSNCRWATPKEQANNRRNNAYITIHGVTKTAQEWAEQIGIKERSFLSRVNYGWDEDRLLEPKNKPLKMTKSEMTKEIKHWRNLEEQQLLVKLPCKVGDKIYEVDKAILYDDVIEPIECTVTHMILKSELHIEIVVTKGHGKGSTYSFNLEDFGKSVFLTKEEAEKALDGLNE